jgi:hypothetical protein
VLGNTGTANGEYDNTGGGTLLITGDLNFGTGFVNNGGYLAVYGELKGGTLDSASQVLKNESGVTVANTVEITGGSISNALKILTSAKPFGGTSPAGTLVILGGVLSAPEGFLVTFDGPAKFITAPTINKAKFNGDVEFDVASITIADAEFAANVEVTATAEQTTATTAKFTGASPTLTGNLSAPTITFNSSGNLTVTGGSLSTESTLALGTSLGSIVLGKAGGIEFTGEGKLTGTGYEVSNAGSLLNTATEVGTMVTLGASGITTDFTGQDDYTPTIVFGGEKLLLNFKDNATINGFNLDIKTGGSISIGTPEAPLANKAIKITGGGSITAQAVAGTIGGGELYIVTNAAGSLVTGAKASLLDAGGSLGAGSYGTATATTNFIYSKVETAQSFFVTSGTDAAFGTLSSYTGPDESTDVGSIALFTSSTLGN